MPQVVLALVGVGLYAGYRWLAGELLRVARRAEEELQQRSAEAARLPKDLGPLEYDTEARVYRPKRSHSD